MVDATDGKISKVRRAFDAMAPSEAARWRQVAMYTAAGQGQSAVVDALLDDGATVDGSAEIPSLNMGSYQRTVDALSRDPRIGAKAVKGMQASGIVSNQPQESGPVIFVAIGCNDLATVNVLLRHHASPMRGWPMLRSADPFISAVVLLKAK
ncbi:MAG: hypothetical protein ABI132_06705 [Rhodanobacteraceae bacterium]